MAAESRAGWHVQHLRHGDAVAGEPASSNTRGDRSRLLLEAMRALDEESAARQARRNPSIVLEDTHLNRAFVNDGNGGLRELTQQEGVEPVLEYGDARIDAVSRKWHSKSFETTTIVSWVPKSLLKEIPDYYPVYNKTGAEVGRRSRWVMPDDEAGRAEVQRWFEETHRHLCEDVLPGGHDAVAGVVWNLDESVPHAHWMADTLAPIHKDLSVGPDRVMHTPDGEPVVKYRRELTLDRVVELDADDNVAAAPEIAASQIAGIDGLGYLADAEGERLVRHTGEPVRANQDLRVEAQQAWGQSSEVTETRVVDGVERQVKITGATKLSNYQEKYRERLVAAGFDVELEVDPEGTSLDKATFGASEADRMEVAAAAAVLETREAYVAAEMEKLEAAQAEHSALLEKARQDRRAAEREKVAAQVDREAAGELKTAQDTRGQDLDTRETELESEEGKLKRQAAALKKRLDGLPILETDAESRGLAAARTAWDEVEGPAYRATVRAEVESTVRQEMADERLAAVAEGKRDGLAQADALVKEKLAEAEAERKKARRARADAKEDRELIATDRKMIADLRWEAERDALRAEQLRNEYEGEFERGVAHYGASRWIVDAMRREPSPRGEPGKSALDHYIEQGRNLLGWASLGKEGAQVPNPEQTVGEGRGVMKTTVQLEAEARTLAEPKKAPRFGEDDG